MDRVAESRRGFLSRFSQLAVAAGAAMGADAAFAGSDEPKPRRSRSRNKRSAFRSPDSKYYSRAVKFGDTIYLSGVFGANEQGRVENDFELQISRTMLNLKLAIERSGSSIHNVLQCTCYLTQSQQLGKFNEIYGKFFPDAPPARTCVVVKELEMRGAMVAIDCVCCA